MRDTVWPLLGGVLAQIQAAEQIAAFLSRYDVVTFFCDAPRYDTELLKPLLPQELHWMVAVPSFETEADEKAFLVRYENAFAFGLRRHHALGDARALCLAWLG